MPAVLLFKTTLQMRDATLDPSGSDFVYVCQTLSAPTALLAGDVSVGLQHFYITLNSGQTTSMTAYLAKSVDSTRGLAWQAYDITAHLSGTPHGSPINSGNYTITSAGASTVPIPEGVAACISYRGNYGTDVEFVRDPSTHKVTARPRSRHRGRIYFGPLSANALIQDSTTFRAQILSTFLTDAQLALQSAGTITDSGSNKWHLSHWSKKNASTEDIVQQWIDTRPDYQRRRADQAMVRQTATYTYT
jgi:hypothetical protein